MSAVGSASSRPSPESTDLPETPAARQNDDLLAQQVSVRAVANGSSGHTDVDEERIQLEVEQLMNVTLNGLYTAVQGNKRVVHALNKELRRKYKVFLKGIGFDDDGEMYVCSTIVIIICLDENVNGIKRITLSERLLNGL